MNFIHSGNIGDVLYSLPTVKAMGGGELYLRTGVKAHYQPGIVHPLATVRMDEAFASCLLPLLQVQPYIARAALWEGEQGIDLDAFRSVQQLNQATGNLPRYYSYAHSIWPDLAQPWLDAEPDKHYTGAIIINRTLRYRNPAIDYSILRNHPAVVFIGLEDEWVSMQKVLGGVEYLKVKDYLHLASILKACKVFIGNQSSAFAVAEGLKCKRILEVFPYAPNVQPIGNAFDCYIQANFEAALNLSL